MGIIDSGHDITNLASGAVRVVIAPVTEDIPASIADILSMESPYALAGDWTDLGATTGPASYSRAIESEGLGIEQASGNIFEDITDVSRSMSLPLAELSPENLQIIENAPAVSTVAAVATTASAQKAVKFGSFSETEKYRVAMIAQRPKDAGIVTESPALVRGRLVVQVLYRVGISADESTFQFGKGQLSGAEVGFTAFPEPGQDADEAQGVWFTEDAGTIAAA